MYVWPKRNCTYSYIIESEDKIFHSAEMHETRGLVPLNSLLPPSTPKAKLCPERPFPLPLVVSFIRIIICLVVRVLSDLWNMYKELQ